MQFTNHKVLNKIFHKISNFIFKGSKENLSPNAFIKLFLLKINPQLDPPQPILQLHQFLCNQLNISSKGIPKTIAKIYQLVFVLAVRLQNNDWIIKIILGLSDIEQEQLQKIMKTYDGDPLLNRIIELQKQNEDLQNQLIRIGNQKLELQQNYISLKNFYQQLMEELQKYRNEKIEILEILDNNHQTFDLFSIFSSMQKQLESNFQVLKKLQQQNKTLLQKIDYLNQEKDQLCQKYNWSMKQNRSYQGAVLQLSQRVKNLENGSGQQVLTSHQNYFRDIKTDQSQEEISIRMNDINMFQSTTHYQIDQLKQKNLLLQAELIQLQEKCLKYVQFVKKIYRVEFNLFQRFFSL